MKKIFISLITVAVLCLFSCSDEDRSSLSSGIVQMKIDGQLKTFKIASHSTDLDNGAVWITFGTTSGIENLMIGINEGDSSLESVSYTVGGILYNDAEGFTSNATVSTHGHVRGTFSGTLVGNAANQTELNITSGTFNILY